MMQRRVLRQFCWPLAIALASTGCASTSFPPERLATARQFIVSCACPTAKDRDRVGAAVIRRGGSVIYVYRTIPGLAVVAPTPGDPAAFAAWLRTIPGVTDVTESGAFGLHEPHGSMPVGVEHDSAYRDRLR